MTEQTQDPHAAYIESELKTILVDNAERELGVSLTSAQRAAIAALSTVEVAEGGRSVLRFRRPDGGIELDEQADPLSAVQFARELIGLPIDKPAQIEPSKALGGVQHDAAAIATMRPLESQGFIRAHGIAAYKQALAVDAKRRADERFGPR